MLTATRNANGLVHGKTLMTLASLAESLGMTLANARGRCKSLGVHVGTFGETELVDRAEWEAAIRAEPNAIESHIAGLEAGQYFNASDWLSLTQDAQDRVRRSHAERGCHVWCHAWQDGYGAIVSGHAKDSVTLTPMGKGEFEFTIQDERLRHQEDCRIVIWNCETEEEARRKVEAFLYDFRKLHLWLAKRHADLGVKFTGITIAELVARFAAEVDPAPFPPQFVSQFGKMDVARFGPEHVQQYRAYFLRTDGKTTHTAILQLQRLLKHGHAIGIVTQAAYQEICQAVNRALQVRKLAQRVESMMLRVA